MTNNTGTMLHDTYRRQLRGRLAEARINGVDISAILRSHGCAKFSEVPDSLLPALEAALLERQKKPERRDQDILAEQVAKLLQTSTVGEARTVYTFASTLIRKNQ